MRILQDNWRIIADECNALPRTNPFVVKNGMSREDVAIHLMINGPQWVQGWDGIPAWWNWGIAIQYQFPLGDAGLPKTAALLKSIPGLKFASLSLFRGNTFLPEHRHPEMKAEGLMTYHLGLDVPEEGAWIEIGAEKFIEANGEAITFDGSLPHAATNCSDNDRLILYCEFKP